MRQTQASLPVGLRAELLYLVMGFIETLWITPFVMVFLPGSLTIPGYQLVLVIAFNLVGSVMIIRLLNNQNEISPVIRFGGVMLIGAVALLATRVLLPDAALNFQMPPTISGRIPYPSILVTLIIVFLLWFRGSRLSTITVTPLRASFALRLGIVCLMFGALIPDARIQRAVLLLLPLFFFFGLIGVALARSASLRLNREVYQSTFGVTWVALTFTIGGTLSVFGFVAALILSGFQFDAIMGAVSNVLVAIFAAASIFLRPIVEFIIAAIQFLFPQFSLAKGEGLDVEAAARKVAGNASTNDFAEKFAAALPMLCLSAVLILIFALILMRLRVRRPVNLRDGEDRETVEGENLLNALRAALANGLHHLNDRLGELNPFAGREALTAFTIRRLYARLMRLAANAGTPRLPYQTPLEYRTTLALLWPAFEREIGELTRAYVDVHYGELPDDPGILDRTRAMLDQLEQLNQTAKKLA